MIAITEEKFHLPCLRFFFFTLLFWSFNRYDYFESWSFYPHSFWAPNGILQIFSKPFLNRETMVVMIFLWKLTIIFSAIGLFFIVSAPLCFILGFIIVNYSHSFGYQGHSFMPIVLLLLPFAFSRAADFYSIDSILFKKDKFLSNATNVFSHFNLKLIFCLVFFMAGLSKISEAGLDWILTDTLRNYLYRGIFLFKDTNLYMQYFPLGKILYNYPILCKLAAASTILIEILCPLSLFYKRSMIIFIPLLLLMQLAALFTIGVNFREYTLMYLIWVPDILKYFHDVRKK